MENEIKTWLFDISNCIDEIKLFVEAENYTFEEFEKDLKTRKAVERNLTIIGEAMNRALQKDENLPVDNARKIVDTRNRIMHGYDKISNQVIWDIIQNYLPRLKADVTVLLND
jgi:uncharacterized protein with HEPN domain